MKTRLFIYFAILATLTACAEGVKTQTNKDAKVYTFGTPTGLSVTSLNKDHVVVSFDFNAAADGGYKVYFGDSTELKGFVEKPGSEAKTPYPTTANSLTIGGLPEGDVAYFAVTALKADGTESSRSAIVSATPTPIEADQKQHTVSAWLEACISELDKITIKEGRMFLSEHKEDSDYPGQGKDCDIEGIRLHTKEEIWTDDGDKIREVGEISYIDRVIPALSEDPWKPTFDDESLDLDIYKIVTTKSMLITELVTINKKCVSIGTNKVEAKLENDSEGTPNTIVMDATSCSSEDGMNFINGDLGTINFTLTYTAAE